MGDAHRAIRLVHMLPARARGAIGINAQILVFDLHIHFLRFRQYGDGHGGGMDAPLGFGCRHALDAMHTAFIFQPGKNAAPRDLSRGTLDAAQFVFVIFQHFKTPAAPFGITLIATKQFRREKPGLIPASGWADFQNAATFIGGIARQQHDADFMFKRRHAILLRQPFGFSQFTHFGISQHGLGFIPRAFRCAVVSIFFDQRFKFRQFLGQSANIRPRRGGEHMAQLLRTRQQPIKSGG